MQSLSKKRWICVAQDETCWPINRSLAHKRWWWLTLTRIRCGTLQCRPFRLPWSGAAPRLKRLQVLSSTAGRRHCIQHPTGRTLRPSLSYLDMLPALLHDDGHIRIGPHCPYLTFISKTTPRPLRLTFPRACHARALQGHIRSNASRNQLRSPMHSSPKKIVLVTVPVGAPRNLGFKWHRSPPAMDSCPPIWQAISTGGDERKPLAVFRFASNLQS